MISCLSRASNSSVDKLSPNSPFIPHCNVFENSRLPFNLKAHLSVFLNSRSSLHPRAFSNSNHEKNPHKTTSFDFSNEKGSRKFVDKVEINNSLISAIFSATLNKQVSILLKGLSSFSTFSNIHLPITFPRFSHSNSMHSISSFSFQLHDSDSTALPFPKSCETLSHHSTLSKTKPRDLKMSQSISWIVIFFCHLFFFNH
jgi:hypothetical protein